MSVQSKVLRLLRSVDYPMSARDIQRTVTRDKDPTARNVRRVIRTLKQGGQPIVTGSLGHLYLYGDLKYKVTLKGARALRAAGQ